MIFLPVPGTSLMMRLDPGAEKKIGPTRWGQFSLDDPEWLDAQCVKCHGSQIAFARVYFQSNQGISRIGTVQDCKWCLYFRGPILS